MTVATILNSKGSEIFSLKPEMRMSAAVTFLCEKGIGAAVVTSDVGALIGILSERDVVRALGAQGVSILDKNVSEFMTQNVQTCAPSETAEALMRRMTEGRFRHLPVIDADNNLCGVISIGDVVKSRINELEYEAEAMRGYIAGHV